MCKRVLGLCQIPPRGRPRHACSGFQVILTNPHPANSRRCHVLGLSRSGGILFMLDGGAVPPSEWPHRGWSMLKQKSRSMWSPNGNRCSQCRLCNMGTNRLRHTLRHSCGHTCCHRSGSPMLNSMLAVVKSSAGNRCSQCQFRKQRTNRLRHTFHRSYTHTSFHCSAGRPSPMSMSM